MDFFPPCNVFFSVHASFRKPWLPPPPIQEHEFIIIRDSEEESSDRDEMIIIRDSEEETSDQDEMDLPRSAETTQIACVTKKELN